MAKQPPITEALAKGREWVEGVFQAQIRNCPATFLERMQKVVEQRRSQERIGATPPLAAAPVITSSSVILPADIVASKARLLSNKRARKS